MTRAFRLLWAGTGASNLADGMVLVLLPLLAIRSGVAPAETALVTVALTLAWPVVGLHAGWVVDRFPRRVVLGAGNAARALALGAIAVLSALGDVPLAAILVAAVVYGVGETLVDTGINASIPALVDIPNRGRANARIEATISITNELAGPPLAGVLVGLGTAIALGTTALLYLAALALVASIAFAIKPVDAAQAPIRIRDGVRVLWSHPALRWITVLNALLNLTWAAWGAVFIIHSVAPGPLGLTAAQYGLLLSFGAVGGILGAVVNGWLRKRVSATVLLFVDTLGTIALVAPAAFDAPVWAVAAGIFFASAGSTTWRILTSLLRQQEVPDSMLGRVYAVYRVISWGTLPIGAALASAVTAVGGVDAALKVATAIAGVSLVLFLVWIPRQRIVISG